MNAVSERLQQYRKNEGLTRTQAAAKVEVSRSTWFRWESGVRRIDGEKLQKVAEVTGIPAKELRPDLAKLVNEAS
jgi:transcriptional regulator with XRE-family HTH domain